jgi:hypothetical protein
LMAGAPATFAAWHAPGVDPADPDLARADLVGELARARPACVLAVRAGTALHDVAGQATGSSSSAGRSL